MTNFVASNHGFNTGGKLCPSPYLDVEVTDEQKELLNPTSRDVQMGAILDQCVGKKAERKLPGGVLIYSREMSTDMLIS